MAFERENVGSFGLFTPEFRIVAKYSYPYSEPMFDEKDFLNVDLNTVCDLACKNKVSLSFYRNLSKNISERSNLLKLKKLFEKRWHYDRHLMFNAEQEIRDLDELLRARNLKYLTHKPFFFSRAQGDIDIIVAKRDFNSVVNALKPFYHQVLRHPVETTFAKWKNNRLVTIDVYSQISNYLYENPQFNPSENSWEINSRAYDLVPEEEIWKSVYNMSLKSGPTVSIPSGEICILMIAAHAFGDVEITLYDLFQLEGVLRRFSNIDWQRIIGIAKTKGWSDFVLYFFSVINFFSLALYDRNLVPATLSLSDKVQDSIVQKIFDRFTSRKPSSMPYELSSYRTHLCALRSVLMKYGASVFPTFPKLVYNRLAPIAIRHPDFVYVGSYYVPWHYSGIIRHFQPEKTDETYENFYCMF